MSFAGRRVPTIASWLVIVFALAILPSAAGAQPVRGDLIVTGSPASDTTGSGGHVTYSIGIKNGGSCSTRGVDVTVQLPSGAGYVRCSTSVPGQVCGQDPSGNVITTFYPIGGTENFGGHATETFNVVITNPIVTQKTVITVHADAQANEPVGAGCIEPRADGADITGTVVPDVVPVVFFPSLQTDVLACGQTLTASFFGSDNTVQFADNMACPNTAFALKLAASSITLDLNGKKIVGATSNQILGSVGLIVAADAVNVTILGRNTTSLAGIEYFDYCLMDEGGNTGLVVNQVRCFRARSAGFDIISDGVLLEKLLVDRTVGGTATAEPPGGVGIRASGNVHIKQSIARRSRTVGMWIEGGTLLDPDADPCSNSAGVRVDSVSQVQDAETVGLLLTGQSHCVKDVVVDGNGNLGTSTNGVLVEGTGMKLEGVKIKQFGQNGIIVNGESNELVKCGADTIGLDGFIIVGANTTLSNSSAKKLRHGFVVSGDGATLRTNTAEGVLGAGFIVTGAAARLVDNRAKTGKVDGFRAAGAGGVYQNNTAEANTGDGMVVSGNSNTFFNNSSLKSYTKRGWNVTGASNSFNKNTAQSNVGNEWEIGPNNVDGGSNSRNGQPFTFGAAGGTFN